MFLKDELPLHSSFRRTPKRRFGSCIEAKNRRNRGARKITKKPAQSMIFRGWSCATVHAKVLRF